MGRWLNAMGGRAPLRYRAIAVVALPAMAAAMTAAACSGGGTGTTTKEMRTVVDTPAGQYRLTDISWPDRFPAGCAASDCVRAVAGRRLVAVTLEREENEREPSQTAFLDVSSRFSDGCKSDAVYIADAGGTHTACGSVSTHSEGTRGTVAIAFAVPADATGLTLHLFDRAPVEIKR